MIIKKLEDLDDETIKSIKKLHKKLTNENLSGNILIFYSKNEFIGYTDFVGNKINWIYGPGHGYEIMAYMEKIIKDKIRLNLSIDKTENKSAVMRRINFYIRLGFKVYNIKWRNIGPLLMMEKIL